MLRAQVLVAAGSGTQGRVAHAQGVLLGTRDVVTLDTQEWGLQVVHSLGTTGYRRPSHQSVQSSVLVFCRGCDSGMRVTRFGWIRHQLWKKGCFASFVACLVCGRQSESDAGCRGSSFNFNLSVNQARLDLLTSGVIPIKWDAMENPSLRLQTREHVSGLIQFDDIRSGAAFENVSRVEEGGKVRLTENIGSDWGR